MQKAIDASQKKGIKCSNGRACAYYVSKCVSIIHEYSQYREKCFVYPVSDQIYKDTELSDQEHRPGFTNISEAALGIIYLIHLDIIIKLNIKESNYEKIISSFIISNYDLFLSRM